MFEMRQLCYTLIGRVMPERKASQESAHWTGGTAASLRAPFSSIFLALSLCCFQAESTSHLPALIRVPRNTPEGA